MSEKSDGVYGQTVRHEKIKSDSFGQRLRQRHDQKKQQQKQKPRSGQMAVKNQDAVRGDIFQTKKENQIQRKIKSAV